MADTIGQIMMIITLLGTFLVIPLNTVLFNRRINDFFNKSRIGGFLALLFIFGVCLSCSLAVAESNSISHGKSPLPWEVLKFALFEGKGSISVFLSLIYNLLYLLWIFFLPAHILSWLKYKEKGKRPFYYYAINLAIGAAIVMYHLANPLSYWL